MDIRIFSAREAAKRFGALLDAVDQGPVTIHRNGRPRAVVLSSRTFADYEKAYKRYAEERMAGLILQSLDLVKQGKIGKSQSALALARRLGYHEEKPGDARAVDLLLDGPPS